MDILIIGDAHVKPGVSLERFDWLGRLIYEISPDVVVDMGDFSDMESLCSYDKGKLGFYDRRYKADVNCALEARDRVLRPLRKAKHKMSRFVSLVGNHEDRVRRAIELEPQALEGVISIDDTCQKPWERIPFLTPIDLQGVAFNHYFPSGAMGRPISGENPATTLIGKTFSSCVAGHSHLLDFSERTTVTGRKIRGLVAGCFLAENQVEEYAGLQVCQMWFRGLIWLKNVSNGNYDLETISIARLRALYGEAKWPRKLRLVR